MVVEVVGQYGVVVVVEGPTYGVVVVDEVTQAGGVLGCRVHGTTRRAHPEIGQSGGYSGVHPHKQLEDSITHLPLLDTNVAVPVQAAVVPVVVVVTASQFTPVAMRLSTPIGNRTT